MSKTRLPDEHRQLWLAFLHAHASVLEGIEEQLRTEHGLPLTAFEVLVFLEEGPPVGLPMQDLAEFALLSKSGLTRLVDRLVESGLVKRSSCTEDRRVTYAVITAKGRQALRRARPLVATAVERNFCSLLSPAEAEVLLGVFQRVLVTHGKQRGLGACGGC